MIIVLAGTRKEFEEYVSRFPVEERRRYTYLLPDGNLEHVMGVHPEKIVAIGTFWDWSLNSKANEVYRKVRSL